MCMNDMDIEYKMRKINKKWKYLSEKMFLYQFSVKSQVEFSSK